MAQIRKIFQSPGIIRYCGLLNLCCGPEFSWEICAVAYMYAPV
jgi:hypothetical protein